MQDIRHNIQDARCTIQDIGYKVCRHGRSPAASPQWRARAPVQHPGPGPHVQSPYDLHRHYKPICMSHMQTHMHTHVRMCAHTCGHGGTHMWAWTNTHVGLDEHTLYAHTGIKPGCIALPGRVQCGISMLAVLHERAAQHVSYSSFKSHFCCLTCTGSVVLTRRGDRVVMSLSDIAMLHTSAPAYTTISSTPSVAIRLQHEHKASSTASVPRPAQQHHLGQQDVSNTPGV